MQLINKTPFESAAIPFKGPDGNAFVTIVVKGTFTLPEKGREPAVSAQQIPVNYGDEPYDPQNGGSIKFEADVAPFKPRADIVLVGSAYAPAGESVTGIDVSLRVGGLKKVLRIYGDRQWRCSLLNSDHAMDPKPFAKMPLVYERAYGGVDAQTGGFCRRNLVGMGYCEKLNKKAVQGKALPNIEDPACLLRKPTDHPLPAGYGFYGRAWQPRVSFMGTYDEQWRITRAPDPPADVKYDYYNAAHPDLQMNDYLAGGEAVELINLSAHGDHTFNLPTYKIACRVSRRYDRLAAYLQSRGAPPEEIVSLQDCNQDEENFTLHLDTLCLMPDEKNFFLLWRGRAPIHDLTAFEVQSVDITSGVPAA